MFDREMRDHLNMETGGEVRQTGGEVVERPGIFAEDEPFCERADVWARKRFFSGPGQFLGVWWRPTSRSQTLRLWWRPGRRRSLEEN